MAMMPDAQNDDARNARNMIAIAIEEVIPKDIPEILIQREKVWIRRYDAIDYGANTRI